MCFTKKYFKMHSSRNMNTHFFNILYRLIPPKTYSVQVFYTMLIENRHFIFLCFPPYGASYELPINRPKAAVML